ncbi:MAG: response regulator transcription factor [Candidatus Omnitrophica bacterium]|nr:response regulator transcription factor [Candidatus Omnitrophota bacterium]
MKILIVEDDKRTASFIIKGLKQEGINVHHVTDGESGLHSLQQEQYDTAIIDIMLPLVDGLTIIDTIRKNNIRTPVIILSARRTTEDRIKGLQAGGDDYLVKPFAFSELLARIYALVRRVHSHADMLIMEVGDLRMDLAKKKVYRNEREIILQPREFTLLEYLMRNKGSVISKTMIMEHVWDYNFDPQTNVVEARICKLRDKIECGHEKKLIYTIRGLGYVLEERA